MRIVVPSEEIVEQIFLDYKGKTSWSLPVIEFDEKQDPPTKYPFLEFEEVRYVGVIPLNYIRGNIYECVIDWCEVI